MKILVLTRLLIVASIIFLQGCNVESGCDKQFCRNGVIVFDTCTRAGAKTIIVTDDNNEAIRCQTKNLK